MPWAFVNRNSSPRQLDEKYELAFVFVHQISHCSPVPIPVNSRALSESLASSKNKNMLLSFLTTTKAVGSKDIEPRYSSVTSLAYNDGTSPRASYLALVISIRKPFIW